MSEGLKVGDVARHPDSIGEHDLCLWKGEHVIVRIRGNAYAYGDDKGTIFSALNRLERVLQPGDTVRHHPPCPHNGCRCKTVGLVISRVDGGYAYFAGGDWDRPANLELIPGSELCNYQSWQDGSFCSYLKGHEKLRAHDDDDKQPTTPEEVRRKKRETQRQQDEKRRADKEAKRLAKPLVERLRSCGPFVASDGIMSYAVGDYKDAHEAADLIEQLTSPSTKSAEYMQKAEELLVESEELSLLFLNRTSRDLLDAAQVTIALGEYYERRGE